MGASCSVGGPKEAEQCMGVSPNHGYHPGGPHNKETSVFWGPYGSPSTYFGKLPYWYHNGLMSVLTLGVLGGLC